MLTLVQLGGACSWVALAVICAISCKSLARWLRYTTLAVSFFVSASITRFGFEDTPSRWQVVGFSILAALLAARQGRLAGRAFAADDWLVSTVAALAAIILVKWFLEGIVL